MATMDTCCAMVGGYLALLLTISMCCVCSCSPMPPKPLSLRSLLLAHLEALPDGRRRCTVEEGAAKCRGFIFSASSDSAAWRNHFASFHPTMLASFQQQLPEMRVEKRSAVAAGLGEEADAASVSAATSASSVVSSTTKRSKSESRPGALLVAFSKQNSKTQLQLLATAMASNSIPHSVVEDDDFRAFLRSMNWTGALPSREIIRSTIVENGAAVRDQIAERIRGAVITVAVDGWTNVNREKVTNVVLMHCGQAFYWSSIVNNEENTAQWLAAQLTSITRSLTDVYHARVIGLVVDNEAVNAAAHNLLLADFPFLLHVPCAAHTIQLVVRSCLQLPQLQPTVEQLVLLIRYFDAKENRISLRRIQEARQQKVLRVLKTCDTRWHSLLLAAERMMLLHKEVITCYDAEKLPGVSSHFFTQLQKLIEFLKPFLAATDRIQRDSATLYTVYQEFLQLRKHADAHAEWATPCLQARWDKRINVNAVVAVALLSFQQPAGQESRAAQQFILSFGTEYLWHYSLSGDDSQQQLTDALRSQLAEFNGRSGEFADLDKEIDSIKRSSAASGVWEPRKVWWLHPGLQLSSVALALLSCSASEAAVERTFSQQGLIHSKRRNRLLNNIVQSEMMMTFNRRVLSGHVAPPPLGCIEMHEDSAAEDEDAATVVPESLNDEELQSLQDMQLIEEDEVEEADASAAATAAAAPSSAQQRALRRAQSLTFDNEDEFLRWFIDEHKLTKSSRLNCNVTIALEGLSRKLMATPGTATLLQKLREKLKQ
jgi:hypothetical protein